MAWNHRVKIKHLLTGEEDHASVQASMTAIADALKGDAWFNRFLSLHKFRQIPEGDDIMRPVDYANRLLERLYDFADDNRIWLE